MNLKNHVPGIIKGSEQTVLVYSETISKEHKHNSAEWRIADEKRNKVARIIDSAGIKFAMNSLGNEFKILVSEEDLKSVQALLLKTKRIELTEGEKRMISLKSSN